MKKLAIIPIAAIALLSSSVLSAQEAKTKRADTLRRELTVMTEEEVSLSTRQPRDLSYTVPAPNLSPVRHSYLDTPIPFTLRPSVSPLGALTAPRGGFERSKQRGYAFASAGIPISFKAGAGLSILSTKTDRLDVYGRYNFANPSIQTELGQRVKGCEKAWRLGANYGHQFEDAALSLGLDFGQHGYNYYGLSLVAPPAGGGVAQSATVPDLRRRATEVSLSARYATEEDFIEDWLYDFSAGFDYTAANVAEEAPGVVLNKFKEFLPELRANLSYRISSMARVGALGSWSLGRLTSTEPILYGFPQSRTASSRMILMGAPYILAEDANDQLSWRALGGLRILTGNDHYNAHFVLFPKIDARLRLGSAFGLRLETDAELVRHSLRAQPLESPFIDTEAFAGRYERIYDAKLTASTTIGSAFSLEAFFRYADHKGAVDYFPASLSLPSGAAASTAYFMPVRFRPSYVDYKEQNVGVQLAYNHRGLFSAALRGVYAHYTTTATILSRPTFTASALVELNMVPNLSVRGGYEFATTLKSYDLDGSITRLRQLHLLHADAVYSLTKRLSLTAELRAPILAGATRWYGYTSQPMLLQGGLQFTF